MRMKNDSIKILNMRLERRKVRFNGKKRNPESSQRMLDPPDWEYEL